MLGYVLALSFGGCTMKPTRTVMTSAPPRAPDCTLKVIDAPTIMTEWEMLGVLNLGQWGNDPDPFSAGALAAIKPDACQMGGEAISVRTSSGGAASSVIYTVWRSTGVTNADPRRPDEI